MDLDAKYTPGYTYKSFEEQGQILAKVTLNNAYRIILHRRVPRKSTPRTKNLSWLIVKRSTLKSLTYL